MAAILSIFHFLDFCQILYRTFIPSLLHACFYVSNNDKASSPLHYATAFLASKKK